MLFFDLGKLPGQQSMVVFHTLARMGIEALVAVSPSSPLASIGYFQDAEKEMDLFAILVYIKIFWYTEHVQKRYSLCKQKGCGLV